MWGGEEGPFLYNTQTESSQTAYSKQLSDLLHKKDPQRKKKLDFKGIVTIIKAFEGYLQRDLENTFRVPNKN